MKISVLTSKEEFNAEQQERLSKFGEVVYTKNMDEYSQKDIIEFCKGSDIIAFAPENLGGFDKSEERLVPLMETIPNLKGLALATTAFGYVDLEYCKKRGITVTNVPYYSTESVAEHVLAFILGCAKRIFISDRKTQKGEYQLIEGFELKGKTLGVIGLGHIGTRVAELGMAIGMKVIGWNRSPKAIPGIEMKTLDEVIEQSDAISINLSENSETRGIISKEKILKLKKGVIIINAADNALVDENAIAEALLAGKIDSYAAEVDDIELSPLSKIENAFLFKGFAWYTRQALDRNLDIWISNVEGIINGKPLNQVR